MEDLTEIANAAGTDKGTLHNGGHGYTLLYDLLFSHRRLSVTDICEIGLAIGGPEVPDGSAEREIGNVPSIKMWREYLPNASVVGVDISDCSAFTSEWFQFVQADCGDPAQLDRVAALNRQFDIILDDGSHASFHQQLTFLKLFPLLKPGGIYIVEDMHWQPDTYEFSLPRVPRTDILFSRFLRKGRFTETGSLPEHDWAEQARAIKSLHMFDEEWFFRHRQLYNARNNIVPDYASYIDTETPTIKNIVGRIIRRVRSEIFNVDSRFIFPKVKIAVIQKAF
ncbi:MAG: hypothetical protein AB7F98_00450 [Novosphingobium sp.]